MAGGKMRTADRQRCKMRTEFADPVRILPLRAGFGKVRSPHFTPGFDNTKCMEISSVYDNISTCSVGLRDI